MADAKPPTPLRGSLHWRGIELPVDEMEDDNAWCLDEDDLYVGVSPNGALGYAAEIALESHTYGGELGASGDGETPTGALEDALATLRERLRKLQDHIAARFP